MTYLRQGKTDNSKCLFALAHGENMELRRAERRLDRDVRIRLSTPDTATSSAAKSKKGTMYPNIDRTGSPTSVLVSDAVGLDHRPAQKFAQHTRVANSAQRIMGSPRPVEPKVGSMENFKHRKAETDLSKKAQEYILESRRPSTRNVYRSRQKLFDSWCGERCIDPATASLRNVSDFLIFLHESKKFKTTTLVGYRTAIAAIHNGWQDSTVSNNRPLSRLIKGIFHSNPSSRKLLPSWDLPLVLDALTKTPL